MFVLTMIYLVQAILCLEWLDPRDFEANLPMRYAQEVYKYSLEFERMKIVHALTLGSIAAFVTLSTCRYRSLNQMHYAQLLIVSLICSILYFLPLVYIAYMSYDPEYAETTFSTKAQAEWEKALIRFADWFYMLLERSDLGQVGIWVSFLVHFQIYCMLLIMQWCAWHIKRIQAKIDVMKDCTTGTY